MLEEQRRRIRVKAEFDLDVFANDEQFTLKTRNLSLKGLLAERDERLSPGDKCRLVLKLSQNAQIKVEAVLLRNVKDGSAFDFVYMDADSFYHLRNIIKSISGEPEKVDKEILTIPAFKQYIAIALGA